MKALLWKLIRQWRDATTTEAAWIARDQIDIELDKFEAAATQEPIGEVSGNDWSTALLWKDHEPGSPVYAAVGAAPVQHGSETLTNKPSDRILSFQIKRAIQAEDALHAAQKEIEHLKSKPKLTDAQILVLWEQTYVQRGTSGIEFARAIEREVRAAPVQQEPPTSARVRCFNCGNDQTVEFSYAKSAPAKEQA